MIVPLQIIALNGQIVPGVQASSGPQSLRALNFGKGFTVTPMPTTALVGQGTPGGGQVTGYYDIQFPGDATLPIAASSLAIGPYYLTASRATTTGAQGALLVAAPMAPDSDGTVDFRIDATDGTYQLRVASPPAASAQVAGLNTFGGTGTYEGPSPVTECTFPLWPTFAWSWTNLTNEWLLGVSGPNATITGTAAVASGPHAGQLELTLAGTVTSAIAGIGLTVSGLTGTPLGNGPHPGADVVYVDAQHVILTDTTYVASDTSGTVIETTPRAISWSTKIEIVVSP